MIKKILEGPLRRKLFFITVKKKITILFTFFDFIFILIGS